MDEEASNRSRIVRATHGVQQDISDPEFELGLSEFLKKEYSDRKSVV